MSEDILAYRLLKSANLSEEQEQLVKATIDRYTFDTMQEQLKRICGDKKMSNEASFKSDIKVESDIFYQKDSQGDDIDDQNETYCEGGQNQYGYKSAKILLTHLIEEKDIIKGQQVTDPVEILFSLIPEEKTLWITE